MPIIKCINDNMDEELKANHKNYYLNALLTWRLLKRKRGKDEEVLTYPSDHKSSQLKVLNTLLKSEFPFDILAMCKIQLI